MSRASEMRKLIRRWEASGLSQRAFAEQEDISCGTLLYWRRRLRGEREVDLAPVRIVPERPRPAVAFDLRTLGGHTLSVPVGFDEGELRRLLDVLSGC